MIVASGKTYIETVRAHTSVRDSLALQLRLSRVLAAMSLQPPSLAASAVICIRRLRAPSLGPSFDVGSAPARAWESAVGVSLARLAASAARPAHGPVAADAEAVVFADRAEMLACLTSDWLRGEAARRWWWKGLLREGRGAHALTRAWLEAPEFVPSALEQLSREGKAVEFVKTLDTQDAVALARRLMDTFALHELHAALDADTHRDETADEHTSDTTSLAESQTRPPAAHAVADAPPWRVYVPEVRAHAVGREHESLLGIALALARAPSHARSQAFARAVRLWRQGTVERAETENVSTSATAAESETQTGSDSAPQHEAARREPFTFQTRPRAPREMTVADVISADERPPAPQSWQISHETSDEGLAAVAESSFEAPRSSEEEEADARPRQLAAHQSAAQAMQVDENVARPSQTGGESSDNAEESPPLPYLSEVALVETKLGGLFYLVNVGLFLELYGDFTTPRQPGLALPIWDFVALLGRRLCGAGVREDDAVWSLLARLAGRVDREELGANFEPPSEWRVPPAWLAPFPESSVWRWSARGGRLRVRHPEGFLILDVPRRARAARSRQLRDEMGAYTHAAEFELRRTTKETDDYADDERAAVGSLERWVSWLDAYVSARLRRALGVGRHERLARVFVEHEAQVRVTPTHVDVVFQLARLPIEVRLSGLDRDPGWVPAAGRFIAFRYE